MTAPVAPARLSSPGGSVRPGRDSSFAGFGELTRFAIRRDRVMLPVWVYALTAIAGSGGYGLRALYSTAADRAALTATVGQDEALHFLYGQLHGSSLGAIAAWRYLAYAAIGAALMSMFLVVRHSRADEETGRLELLGSTVVGRRAPLAVALTVAVLASLVLAATTTLVLWLSGLPISGSAAFALAVAGCGVTFAALTAIAAQVSSTARTARGLVVATLALAFLLRGVGDSGSRHGLAWLTWLSPVGWAELARPFGGNRWWVLALPAAATVTATAIAFVLAARRDHGAGLRQPGPGPASAGHLLAGPGGLAWRLQRGSVAAWSAGFGVGGLAVGVLADGIGKLLGTSPAVEQALARIGGQAALVNAYLSACMSLFGVVAAAFAVAAVLRLRAEESDGRAEPLLAAPVGRVRWAGTHLLTCLFGTVAVLVAGGLGTGLGYGLAISQLSVTVPRLLGAALVQVPAALVLGAIAMALIGLVPRSSVAIAWTVTGAVGFIAVFGPVLRLSQAVLDVSPFSHVPKIPGGPLLVAPLIWLTATVLILSAAGLAGLRRRDIG